MAKTRAQRKAERRRRQQAEQRRRQADPAAEQEERAQEETRLGVSGEVAEAEAVIQTGADVEDYGERVEERPETGGDGSPVPGVMPAPVRPEPAREPQAPAPSPADVGRPEDGPVTEAPADPRESRRERRQREKEERRKARARELQKKGQAEKAERRRGPIIGFLLSCWAELKRVQWPDRDTLVQASAVTFIFVAIMAAYLGALDAAFNWFVKQLL